MRAIHSVWPIPLLIVSTVARPAEAQSNSERIQPPTFRQPERGSLTGSLAKFSIGAEDASRGSFSLPLPIDMPTERAVLLARVFPSYSPESGISEWGAGWSSSLAIHRFRLKGDIDYQSDEFSSPWGRLQQGSDGFYYPVGLTAAVRLERTAQSWIAIDASGGRHEFTRAVVKPGGTYSWYLQRVTSVLGDVTTIEYAAGPDGRPFVSKVFYGGPEDPTTYRLIMEHELLPLPLVDYRSGYPISLDRRVVGVVAWAKQRGSGTYRRRWRYDLTYHDDHFGPGFRLDSVMRTFASGEEEPPVTYEYELPEIASPTGVVFGTGDLEDAPHLDALREATQDPDTILSRNATTTDLDDDGLPDLEHGFTFTAFRQGADGSFTAEPLGPRPPGGDYGCRPDDAFLPRSRTLVRMGGPSSDLQVLRLEPQSGTTEIRVCDRDGLPRLDLSVPGHWTLGENVKLADLNHDEKPDLLQVSAGMLKVLENTSGEAGEIGFLAHAPIALTYVYGFPFTPSATWVHDINGDGNPDLIQRSDDSMSVWYGSGRFGFDVIEHPMEVLNGYGEPLMTLDDWEVTWVDANKDGLTDMLMAYGSESALFINEGDHFAVADAPVLEHANMFHMGVPVIADYRGRGDLDLYFMDDQILAAELLAPATGLLTRADDGKGNVVAFEYERSAPVPGVRQRPAVLRSMTASSGGQDDLTVEYDYTAPRTHTVGHFLVGFGTVEASGPVTTSSADFYNDDDVTAQLETSRVFDSRTPGLMRVSRTTHEEAIHEGVRVRRPRTITSGWCAGTDVPACLAGTTAALETSETLAYERGVCPTRVRTVSRHGTLERTVTLASPAALAGALHCAQSGDVSTGTHPDPSLNFRLEEQASLNDLGQPTQILRVSGTEVLVVQDITYDPVTHRVSSISTPGRGTQIFTFDPEVGQLQRIDAADGTVASVQERDPKTDALQALTTDRGPGGVLVASFRYDGMERLADRWSDFGGSSAAIPLESVDYQFPTLEFPGLVQVSSLVDAVAQTRTEEAVWTYPDGGALTAARRAPNGWVVGPVHTLSRSELREARHRRTPLGSGEEVALQTYATLLTGMLPLAEASKAGFGHEVTTRQTVQEGVERATTGAVLLDKRLLVSIQRENDLFESRSASDAAGRVVWVRNQSNYTTQFKRDASGRLVGVTLPGGTTQTLTFDGFGRPARVGRSGVGDILYEYETATGLLKSKSFRDADDELQRTVTFHYDAIGRLRERVDVRGNDEAEAHFLFRYDGDVGTETPVPGQKGYLTQVEGPAYKSTSIKNPDGSEASSSLELAGWMRIDTTTSYYAGGQVNQEHRTITRLGDAAVVDDVTTRHVYDAWGRLGSVEINGTALAELHYDDDNQIAWVGLPDGQRIDHLYDPATLRQTGFAQEIADGAGTRQTGQDWTFNDRGLIASEGFDLGDQSWLRSFRYDARGYLTRSEDADQLATYSYTSAGLPKQITDEEGTRTVNRAQSRQLTVDGLVYTWDASGRVIQRGPTTFDYGPDGNLAVAHATNRTLVYHYDADGNRLLKYQDGLPVAGYIGGGYLTENGFVAPVKIGGRVVGVLDHGELSLLATDSRGTLLADRDGTPRLGSPYGVRATRPDLAAALDYVEKAYDPDLASIRMGVRDYDPLLGQFWTPDPLYLEAIETCAESPIDCNLFSYVRNDPLRYVDPAGTDGFEHCAGMEMTGCAALASTGQNGVLRDVAKGFFGAGIEAGAAIFNSIRHPVKTAESLRDAVTHPLRTAKAVWGGWKASVRGIASGDGEKIGGLLFGVATAGVGKGVRLADDVLQAGGNVARGTGGGLRLFHGTDVDSALGFLNGGALNAAIAAGKKVDGPAGFFMATVKDDAVFFAARRAGTVLEINLSERAARALRSHGMIRQAIPPGKTARFVGDEFIVPTRAFGTFNDLLQAGEISFGPGL